MIPEEISITVSIHVYDCVYIHIIMVMSPHRIHLFHKLTHALNSDLVSVTDLFSG